MTSKRALILGVGGQDGSYMADILLEKGYEVHGLHRRSSVDNLWRIKHLLSDDLLVDKSPFGRPNRITLHRGDLGDPLSVNRAIQESNPQEIYNLADQDDVGWSYNTLAYSMDVTAAAVGRLLAYCRCWDQEVKVFQPISATVFGNAPPRQNEGTPLNPLSPYACAKAAAWHLCRYHRQVYGTRVWCGVLYNHDSPRRGKGYLLDKVCQGALDFKAGRCSKLAIGDLSQHVDLGFAREYVEAAWLMLQEERFPSDLSLGRTCSQPDDYVLCSGRASSICNIVAEAFRQVGIEDSPRDLVVADPRFATSRPGPTACLAGDYTKAHRELGFEPRTTMEQLVAMKLSQLRGES